MAVIGECKPRKMVLLSWLTSLVLPCIRWGARMTRPPKAAPIAWCPRQTPSTGTLPENFFTTAIVIPASSGVHGPGESRMRSGFQAFQFLDGYLVIAANYHFRTQFSQVLDQVVGKGIVVIQDKNHNLPYKLT